MPLNPLFLATAVEAVVRAGGMQLAYLARGVRIDKKGAIDLVTDADVAVETMFREMVAERFPGHAVLAEELGDQSSQASVDSRFRWVFDPIDGTTNYAHGLPIYCASLALEIDGRPEVAAVYDPSRRELFTAERGSGARLNGRPMRVSSSAAMIDAMLCTGFPYDVHATLDEVIGLFGEFVRRARAVRRLGSAAIDLCYVAAGRLDGFWEQRLHAWDIAAGALIVEEAGGQVSTLAGEPFDAHRGEVVASNGRIHRDMVATITGCLARQAPRAPSGSDRDPS